MRKFLKYFFGIFMLLCAWAMFSEENMESFLMGPSFIFLAIQIFPMFDKICKLTNRRFSIGRKVALAIGTFAISVEIASASELAKRLNIFGTIVIIVVFWIIMFATCKNKFVNIEKMEIKEKNKKKGFIYKIYNSIIEKRNAKVIATLEFENKVKENFCDLNIMTIHAIAKMIGETREKHNSIFCSDMPEINISSIIFEFCKDIQEIENEFQLNNLYTKQYYLSKINKCCVQLKDYTKEKIRKSLPYSERSNYMQFYNKYLNIFLESMSTFSGIKFYRTISNNGQQYDMDKNFGEDLIDHKYRDAFLYLIDALATSTCIAKMIFIERRVKNLDNNAEFYKIIYNMSNEIVDIDTIIKKSRPIYDEFYKTELGFINDELLYGIAVANLANRIINKEISDEDKIILNIVDKKINNLDEFDNYIKKWILEIADNYRFLKINKYIIFKIMESINLSNFELLLEALGKTNEYSKLYYDNVEFNNKKSDKERYLKGDFEKEKKELSGKYSLNNIVTGTQFELYLVRLFEDLNYKVKHNGKAGDQGADLILKKDDYIYVVQAKYYSEKLGNTPVQEIVGALKYYNANQGVVITNSSFTNGAEELAKANNVILIDGEKLRKLIDCIFEENHREDVLKRFE